MEAPQLHQTIRVRVVNLDYVQAARVVEIHPDGSYDYMVWGQMAFQPMTLSPEGVSWDGNRVRIP